MAYGKIYALLDPRTGQVRYIGFTRGALETRLRRHLREAHAGTRTHKCAWLRELSALTLTPRVCLVEEVTTLWQPREQYWIAHYRQSVPLVNGTDGGDGRVGHKVPSDVREKISQKLKGRRVPEEQRRKSAEGLRGKAKTPEHVAKLTGRKRSDETRQRMSLARKGIRFSAETRQKLSQAMKAKPFDDARAEQLAAARTARATKLKEKKHGV